MINLDALYTKENIIAHTEDYKVAKENLKFTNKTKKYLKSNIMCYRLYKLVCFMYYKTSLMFLTEIFFKLFKRQVEKTKELGEEI